MFFLVLLRVSLVIAFLPVFGSSQLPRIFKIGLVVGLSIAIVPLVKDLTLRTEHLVSLTVSELLLSVALALTVRLIFFGVDIAGQLMSTTMGLSMATVFNPEIGQSTELARFYGVIAIILFFALDLHHQVIIALIESFRFIPAGGFSGKDFVEPLVGLVGRVFVFAVRVSLPLIIVMMVVNIVLGILYKVIPQFNLFFVGYPLYIGLGFLVVLLGLPFFITALKGAFSEGLTDLGQFIMAAGGR